jgi:flagellar basal-body rod modification protein FlgD
MVTTTAAPSSTSSTTNTVADRQMLAQNFDQFLTLLTAQLKNQDPTSPMDTNQFTSQLVQFASVEQQMKQNETLTSLVSNTNNTNAIGALNFVGHQVTASGTKTALTSGSADWILNAPRAGTATISITDSNGAKVYSTTKALSGGQQTFHWDGKNAAGVTLSDGLYSIAVDGKAIDQSAITVATEIYGTVDGVDLSGTTPSLKMGNLAIDLTSVKAIDNPPPATIP